MNKDDEDDIELEWTKSSSLTLIISSHKLFPLTNPNFKHP
jgi:hypothetical protein